MIPPKYIVVSTIRGSRYYIREDDRGNFYHEGLIENATKYDTEKEANVVYSIVDSQGSLTVEDFPPNKKPKNND